MLQLFRKSGLALVAIFFVVNSSKVIAQNSIYNSIVAKDGSGQHTTIQAAINAVPDDLNSPWLIFVKNGDYDEQVIIPKSKKFIHLIGQDKEKTIIHHKLNVGSRPADEKLAGDLAWQYSVHNPQSKVYKLEGSVVTVEGSDFYSENISYVNDFGKDYQRGPQALAMKTPADRVAFNNCKFISYQDTWMTTSKDAHRHYVKDCWIEGAVDYFYGSGVALLEGCTFYNVRSGSVIVASCQNNAKFGYVFRDCIIDGNSSAADGKIKLGRPWHHSPKAVYINTTMRIPVAPEGWTNMGTVPELYAEYNSRDAQGNLLDLSKRKTEYQGRDKGKEFGISRATITKEEADECVYENLIPGTDKWDPRMMMKKLSSPKKVMVEHLRLKWSKVPGATGYLVSNNDQVVVITDNLFCTLPHSIDGIVKVFPINKYGSLGEAKVLTFK